MAQTSASRGRPCAALTTRNQLILGTAGHIDHGKTALVRTLTGVDTDRLPEERRRGMTIDIGFARLELDGRTVGIVDVPGHERFIRNMVAGATGIDLALLVVAADDSVMPQTREHLDILKLLDLRYGLVAITKCDLVDESDIELVQQEIGELVAGTFLEQAPVVPTSAVTGFGIENLRSALAEVCQHVRDRSIGSPFRLSVDRSFVMSGHGTVVTGSVSRGSLRVGGEVEWMPTGKTLRVRSLETHGRPVEAVQRGQRAAVGLGGVHHTEIRRGDELATPGFLKSTRLITARIDCRPESPWPIKHRSQIRLHLGAAEVTATVALLSGQQIAPGQSSDAQLFVSGAVTATCGQPFVLRSLSPVTTLGGGRVLAAGGGLDRRIPRRRVNQFSQIENLASSSAVERAAAALWFQNLEPWTDLDLCRDANLELEAAEGILNKLRAQGMLVDLSVAAGRAARIHRDHITALEHRLIDEVGRYHSDHRLHSAMPRSGLSSALRLVDREPLLNALIERARQKGSLSVVSNGVASHDFQPRLSGQEQRLYAQVIAAFAEARFTPPTPTELAKDMSITEPTTRQIIDLAVERGRLKHLGGRIYLEAEAETALRDRVAERLREKGELTVSEIRQLLETSRKFAVPFCQYLDRVRVTRRQGDLRVLGSQARLNSTAPKAEGVSASDD